ncbi:cupin domain-containing protein [Halalkalibacter oceani]|uniref:cupin domain-containing protein n=1 Tax=Halalkalibacter oceani TaxID=1653776 RepID=UPI0033989309
MTYSDVSAENQSHLSLLSALSKKASTIDLYRRLAASAPNKEHQNEILRLVEDDHAQLRHMLTLYVNMSGCQPIYDVPIIPFQSYREGLQKAYQTMVPTYEHNTHSSLRHSSYNGLSNEQENLARIRFLYEDAFKRITDFGPDPFAVQIEEATKQNQTFRTALWTGKHLQITLMSIEAGEDIGLEIHPTHDQFIRLEEGQGLIQMGERKDHLPFQQTIYEDYATVIPAGIWHNLTNTGDKPLKLYSIYAPPQHPHGTIHETKAIAIAAEDHHPY